MSKRFYGLKRTLNKSFYGKPFTSYRSIRKALHLFEQEKRKSQRFIRNLRNQYR